MYVGTQYKHSLPILKTILHVNNMGYPLAPLILLLHCSKPVHPNSVHLVSSISSDNQPLSSHDSN